ncbi:hypothetical protein G6F57_013778 [Rhizopus arrhizus]|uniref:Uncharacterized protein n=1 Tax=Rhizopus oryzae TaxID=64495 RepID=A0A9P6WWL8_RHIOR|nr:hypothetical protein G6F23_011496 [Rhizopus arrhizus]KAG1395809.1 hypothetical protein G6F58_011863 [Rhizopus delemar]KAG0753383.1 hypothetical protein G6F24_013027 [Rhizopus arrhizus]KAG0776916.1 hypothetical protein G6F22_012233 [Rhizopus arrhizus]KAG0780647.1 hypothetical protein G6F21_012039 [Rhizopus arrhizus]
MERTNLVFMSVEMYPPANRPTILSLIEEQRNDISAKQNQIQVLDENVEGERSRVQNELVLALNTVPAPDLNQLLLELGWPMVDVCQDLNLPYEYALMARRTYNPTRIATNDNNEKIIVQEENDKVTQLLQRISLLEVSLNRQTHRNASSTQRKSTKPAIDTFEFDDPLPTETKRQMFGERRKRAKIPQFTSGNSEVAQQWLQPYEVLCEYLVVFGHY